MAPTDSSACPSLEQLAELLEGSLAATADEQLTRHLDRCPRCRERLDRLAAGDRFLSAIGQQASEPQKRSELLESAIDLLKASPPTASPQASETPQPFADLLPWLEPSPRGIGRVDGYVLTRFLGRGGMGVVFAGWEEALDRPVAVKFLKPSLAADAAFRERFTREARAAAAVIHPNVVTILAVIDVHGLPALVMERVEGASLEMLTDRDNGQSRLPVVRIAEIGRQVAAGLHAAHTAGLLHRDVKPGNILIATDGAAVKLVDFGLACSLAEARPAGEPAGTPGYVSPEVLAGERPTVASDLYGLGCVLHDLLNGEPPAQSHASGRHPPHSRTAADRLTEEYHWLADIVGRLLAGAPADRFHTAADVEAALAAGLRDQQPEAVDASARATPPRLAPPPPSARASSNLLAIGFGLIAALALWPLAVWRMQPLADDTPISSPEAFREAIADAEPGSVITVAADVTLELESLDLADCDLSIRGGSPRPVLRLICDDTTQRQSLFRLEGFLRLEDLSLQLVCESTRADGSVKADDGDAVRCLIDLDGGSLVLSDCLLTAAGDSTCLQVDGGSQLELIDCQLHAPQGCGIDWKPEAGGEATAVSTFFSGRTAWAIADPVDASLVLERITAVVDRLAEIRFDDLESPDDGQLSFEVQASAIAANESVVVVQSDAVSLDAFEHLMAWQGRSNLIDGPLIRIEGETALFRPAWLASDADVSSIDAIDSIGSELRSLLLQMPLAEIRDWPCREGPPPAEAFELKAAPELRDAFPDQPPGAVEIW